MAKESVSAFELGDVATSKAASNVIEKRFTSLNGFDASLRKDAILLVLSDTMKEEDRVRGTIKFKHQFFWALDIERNKLVKVSRTSLAGGMGYTDCPKPGIWDLNEDRTWHVLKPQEDDPALATRVSWGISKILPGAFEFDKKKISIPRCFVIEVTKVDYLCSRNPVNASASAAEVAKELADCTFKPDLARMWDGKAYYPTREFVNEAIAKFNSVHESQFTEDTMHLLK